MRFEPIKKLPAYKLLSEAVLTEIMAGRIRLGDQLPTEAELCAQFGVNRSTVREGIRLLEEAGVLSREGGKRFIISRPSAEQLSNQLQRAMVLHEITFDQLWEAVITIEPPMARLAACRRNPRVVAELDKNIAETEMAIAERRSLVELDIEFHNLIAAAAGNAALTLAREPLVQLFYPAFGAVFAAAPKAGERLLVAHRNIAEALRRKDQAGIEIWMRKHLQDFKRGVHVAKIDVASPITSAPAAARGDQRALLANRA